MVLRFGVRHDMLEVNPAREVRVVRPRPRDTIWTDDEFDLMIRLADRTGLVSMGTAIMMAGFLGQRRGDLLALRWENYDGDTISLKQSKTGRRVAVKVTPELRLRLDALPRDHEHILIYEATGKPDNGDTFCHRFIKLRAAAAVERPEVARLQFVDLRRSAVVWIGEEGATEAQIAAITGHRIEGSRQILETYLPRNATMAAAGIDKLTARRARRRAERDKRALNGTVAGAAGAAVALLSAAAMSRGLTEMIPVKLTPANWNGTAGSAPPGASNQA